jgi:hypothetical protein
MLALALTAMAGAALGCAWISLPPLGFVPLAAGIVLAWAWHVAEAMQRGKRAMRALELGATGSARYQDGSGNWHEADLLPGGYTSRWLIVLNLGGGGRRRRALALLPDSAADEDLRRLRVWLRWRLGRP